MSKVAQTTTTQPDDQHDRLKHKFAGLYNTFGVDPRLEAKGVLLRYELANGTFAMFRIKRSGSRNPEWRRLYNELMKPHEDHLLKEALSEQETQRLLAEVYGRSVIVDWAGILDGDGKEIPFSVEACIELLNFMPDLFNLIVQDSRDRANFREEQLKATEKN